MDLSISFETAQHALRLEQTFHAARVAGIVELARKLVDGEHDQESREALRIAIRTYDLGVVELRAAQERERLAWRAWRAYCDAQVSDDWEDDIDDAYDEEIVASVEIAYLTPAETPA